MVDVVPYGGQQLQTTKVAAQPQKVVGAVYTPSPGDQVASYGSQQLQTPTIAAQPQQVVGAAYTPSPGGQYGGQQLQTANIAAQPQQVVATPTTYTPSPRGQVPATTKYTSDAQRPIYATAPGYGGPGATLFNVNPAAGGFVQQQTPVGGYAQGVTVSFPGEQQTQYVQPQAGWYAEPYRGGGCCTIS